MTELPKPQTKTARLPDGRTLAYVETGDPDGAPVFAFHGLPGSRLQRHPDEEVAHSAGLRIIHPDRPGFGLSSRQSRRSIADWPRDVAALADTLGLERFAITGVSGGGPYAAACLTMLGSRIQRAAIVSSVGPPGSMHGHMAIAARLGFFMAAHTAWAARASAASIMPFVVRSPDHYLDVLAAHMAPPDRPILARPRIRAMLAQDLREAFRQGVDALVEDLGLLARPWGFGWDGVECPVALWHGEDDWMIPPSASRHLAAAIPGARAHMLPREAHFLIFDHWPEICGFLAGAG
jgi:pimeloyl-ACP methyl ester carboxylesterase